MLFYHLLYYYFGSKDTPKAFHPVSKHLQRLYSCPRSVFLPIQPHHSCHVEHSEVCFFQIKYIQTGMHLPRLARSAFTAGCSQQVLFAHSTAQPSHGNLLLLACAVSASPYCYQFLSIDDRISSLFFHNSHNGIHHCPSRPKRPRPPHRHRSLGCQLVGPFSGRLAC